MARQRTNITIDPKLHEEAKNHARLAHGTDFSGLVTKLLIADLGEAYLQKKIGSNRADEVITLLKKAQGAEEERMEHGPRSVRTVSHPSFGFQRRSARSSKEAADLARAEVDRDHRRQKLRRK